MSHGPKMCIVASVMFVAWVSTAFAGGMVGPAPAEELREFGSWSLGGEVAVIAEHDFMHTGEGQGAQLMAKAAFTVLERIDLELLGGGTYQHIDEDTGLALEDVGTSTIGGVGVNINAWHDRITGIDIGLHGRFEQSSPGGQRWSEWWFATTLGRPFDHGNSVITPYVGVKLSQVDIDVDLETPQRYTKEQMSITEITTIEGMTYYEGTTETVQRVKKSIKFEERRRVGVLAGVRCAFRQRNELVLEVQTVDQTAVCLGYRRMF